jgi:hypothetical protein
VLAAAVLVLLGAVIVGVGEFGHGLAEAWAATGSGRPPSPPWPSRGVGAAVIVLGVFGPLGWFLRGAARCASCGQRILTAGGECSFCGDPVA